MSYTDKQITEEELLLLEHFDSERPVPYDFDAVQSLTSHHLLNISREENGLYYWELSREGRLVLERKRKEEAAKEEQEAKEKSAEAKRLMERHEDHTREERYHRSQNRVSITSAVIGSCLSFVLGLLVEHHAGVVGFLIQFFHAVSSLLSFSVFSTDFPLP